MYTRSYFSFTEKKELHQEEMPHGDNHSFEAQLL